RFSIASGVLIGLAVLTKQTSVAVAVVLTLEAVLSGRARRVLAIIAGMAIPLGIAAAFLEPLYGAWPALYLIDLPRQHSLQLERLAGFWSRQVLPAFTLPLVALPVFLLGRLMQAD